MAGFEFSPEMIDAMLRGGGSASTAAPAASAAPAAASGVWDFLTKQRSLMGAAKTVGTGALKVGGAAKNVLGTSAALIPAAAGVAASKMAGGDVASGLDPMLFSRALGEGYARYAPTWLGGLPASAVAAGDSQGASDIGHDFAARAIPAATAPRPVAARASLPSPPAGANTALDREDASFAPVVPSLAPVTPFTAADIAGTRVPASGTGAFVNNTTGAVTNLDTRTAGPGAVPTAYVPKTAAGNFFQGGTGLKQIAGDNATKLANTKLMLDLALRGPTASHAAAQARNEDVKTQAAIAHLAANPGDYAGAATVAAGRALPADSNVFLPTMDASKIDVGNKRTGAIQRKTPIPTLTKAEAIASAKKNGKYVSDAQVLRDVQAMGYKVAE